MDSFSLPKRVTVHAQSDAAKMRCADGGTVNAADSAAMDDAAAPQIEAPAADPETVPAVVAQQDLAKASILSPLAQRRAGSDRTRVSKNQFPNHSTETSSQTLAYPGQSREWCCPKD